MRILLTGATGLIGKELGKALVLKGHEVVVLTRNASEARKILPYPARVFEWDTKRVPDETLEGVESIIHLAGESIGSGRWSAQRKKEILESRVHSTQAIVHAVKKNPKTVKQFISTSAIGIYGSRDDIVSETSSHGQDFLADVCKKWEEASFPLKELGINVVNPRVGIVLSRYGGALEKMLPPFRLGFGGAIGSGKQWMSWIHLDDLVSMFVHLVQHQELSGAFNAVAPTPVTNLEFSRTLAQSLQKRLFFPVPSLILKIALGEMSVLATEGQKVSAEKIQKSAFTFKYPELKGALEEICAPLREGKFELFCEQWVPKNPKELFPFFSNEKNLERITPPYLNFRVVGKSTPQLQEGTEIRYKLGLHGIPLRWKSRIEDWRPGEKFVDRQLQGPYSLWHHTHEFVAFAGGTIMRDKVAYKVPMGILGEMVAGAYVRSDVKKIFAYRQKIICDLFWP